ncbi:MAG: NAD(+)/NADH kinase [Muribaculaceae bacterium]|nr:NAD(+)/NADH kinase [Muribaculaceae bacterium]MDE7080081.1 NAD(+)/NADH kinase [Muribaculaceae bacterium]
MPRLDPVRLLTIAGNTHQAGHLHHIRHLLDTLRSRGIRLAVERRFAQYLGSQHIPVTPDETVTEPPAEAGAALSIGGDGTFLRTARWIGRLRTPVLGINTGHLGFLASYSPAETEMLSEMLLHGDAEVESRMALRVDVGEADRHLLPPLPYALNEVAILKEETASMISVNVDLSGNYLADYLADGLLISTPTGSTGYNLSAGGPILFPDLDVISLAPIAPHTLTARPVVVSGSSVVRARTTSRSTRYRVSLDGVSFLMPEGSEITVTRADFAPRVIRRRDDSFADTLRHKLLWGMR